MTLFSTWLGRALLAAAFAAFFASPGAAAFDGGNAGAVTTDSSPDAGEDDENDPGMILDNRGEEAVMLFWLAPPVLDADIFKAPLKKNVLLGAMYIRQGEDDSIDCDDSAVPELRDGTGAVLKMIPESEWPQDMLAMVAMLRAGFQVAGNQMAADGGEDEKVLAGLLQKLRFFVFEPGAADACASGGLDVAYAGKAYHYDTPFPGCPK